MQSIRVFRVFISSTFSDLLEERNILNRRVFPKLRKLCADNGCRFQAIDLRWGLSRETGMEQQTMRICLEEIRRCKAISPRPNFIVLLGDRYGWRPLPYEIPENEWRLLLPHLGEESGIAERWYKEDENAVPPVYCLQPRDESIGEGDWLKIEHRLQSRLMQAAEAALPEQARLKYTASATEQEIHEGALNEGDSRDHVFCFFRGIRGLPASRQASKYTDLNPDGSLDTEAQSMLNNLKENLRKKLPGNVCEYGCDWQADRPTAEHLEALCRDVEERLTGVILNEIRSLESKNPLTREVEAHALFMKERSAGFIGRDRELAQIRDYIQGQDNRPLVIHGLSGCGKSALLAKAASDEPGNENRAAVCRFIGATSGSVDEAALLHSICEQIATIYGKTIPIPKDYNQLLDTFSACLKLPDAVKPLALFVDAADQLIPSAAPLAWLPAELPQNVKLVLSTLTIGLEPVLKRAAAPRIMEVTKLSTAEGGRILDAWLAGSARRLTKTQHETILAGFAQCPYPLYLRLAYYEGCRWRSYDTGVFIGADIPALVEEIIRRLSSRTHHGSLLVGKCLGLLAASRNGLSEDELLDLLSRDEELLGELTHSAFHELPEPRIPVVLWSRLYFDLESYLMERTADGVTVFGFYHRQIAEKAAELYCSQDAGRRLHRHLALYFQEADLWHEGMAGMAPNARKAAELPYQLSLAGMTEALEATLTDIGFIRAKSASDAYDLLTDYERAGAKEGSLAEFAGFIARNAHILAHNPDLAYQQAMNEPDGSAPATRAAAAAGDMARRPWLRWINKPRSGSPLAMTISGFGGKVTRCLWSPDGKWIFTCCEGFATSIESAIWEAATGKLLRSLQRISGMLVDVKVSPDGTQIALLKILDCSVLIIDPNTGGIIRTLGGQEDRPTDCAYSPDGKMLAVGMDDGTVNIWDTATGKLLEQVKNQSGRKSSCCFSPDGKILAIGLYDSLLIWDVKRRRLGKTITPGNNGGIIHIAFSPGGGSIVAAHQLGKLEILETENYTCKWSASNFGSVLSIQFTPNGVKMAVLDSNTLNIIDTVNMKCTKLAHIPSHLENAGISISPDGRLLAATSPDNTVKIWHIDNESEQQETKTYPLGDCVYSPQSQKALALRSSGYVTWDIPSGSGQETEVKSYELFHKILRYPHDGNKAVIMAGSTIKIVNTDTGEITQDFGDVRLSSVIESAAITSDGCRVAYVFADKSIEFCDLKKCQGIASKKVKYNMVNGCTFLPDDRYLLTSTASYDLKLMYWDPQTGKVVHVCEQIGCDHLLPDGKSALGDSMSVINIVSGKRVREKQKPAGVMAVSPDGRNAVLCISDNMSPPVKSTFELWDLSAGRRKALLLEADYKISSDCKCGFSADCRLIFISSADGYVRLYSQEGEQLSAVFTGGSKPAGFTYAFEKSTLITGTADTYLLELMNHAPGHPVTTATRRYSHTAGDWEPDLTADCGWCGSRFVPGKEPEDIIINEYESIIRNVYLELPESAFEDARLTVQCDHCGRENRLNPFIVDNLRSGLYDGLIEPIVLFGEPEEPTPLPDAAPPPPPALLQSAAPKPDAQAARKNGFFTNLFRKDK